MRRMEWEVEREGGGERNRRRRREGDMRDSLTLK